jgi:DNA invertase Pin-like site-specific DNA recombinase
MKGSTMTVIGYARVSTTDQNLSIQEAACGRPAAT